MSLKDQFIIAQIRNGKIKAFENVFRRNYAGMLKYSTSILKNEELAEEVVQDIFYSIWKNRSDLKISSLDSYLYKSVYNNSLMALRRKKHEIRMDDKWLKEKISTTPDPFEIINEQEMQDLVLEILDKLPERTRTIFIMSRFEGLKYNQIAEKLAISVKTVEANMGKALKLFRAVLLQNNDSFQIR